MMQLKTYRLSPILTNFCKLVSLYNRQFIGCEVSYRLCAGLGGQLSNIGVRWAGRMSTCTNMGDYGYRIYVYA